MARARLSLTTFPQVQPRSEFLLVVTSSESAYHDLRHAHATLLLRQGVHVKVVSERAGHSAVGIALGTYGHDLPGKQEEATEKLEWFRS